MGTANWWNGTSVTSWTNGSSATFGNGGVAGPVSVDGAITIGNLTFNAVTSSNHITTPYGQKPVVAYMSNFEPNYLDNPNTADFVFSNITHLIYIGAWTLNADGSLVIGNASALSNIVAITHAHGRKVMFTIGDGNGTDDGSGKLMQICTNAAARANLITNILQYCQQNNLDGVDIDWEFPPASARASYVTFLSELRNAAPPGFYISIALMTGDAIMAQAPVDWIYIMAYTFNLSQCQTFVDSWLSNGAPPSRLVLGLGIYGQNSSGGAMGYSSLIGTNNIDPSLDSYNGYTFTGGNTVKQLTRYVYENSLGGIGWFRVELDTCDHRSLMQAGAEQARASASAFGLGDGYLIHDGTLTLSSGTTFTANTNATISSILAGNNGWTKLGPATLVLGGNNTFAGGKNINTGTVRLSHGNALGNDGYGVYVAAEAALELAAATTYDFNLSGGLAGTLRSTASGATLQATNNKNQQLSNGGTIDVATGATLAVWDPVWGSGGFTKTGTGILYLFSNTSVISGNITISDGILQIGGANAANINGTSYSGNIVNNSVLDLETTTTQTLGGIISGTGSVRKGQGNTINLTGANTYSGGTTISGGTLTAGSGGALGTGMLTMNGGVMNMGGYGLTIGGLQGAAGLITSGGYAITLTVNQSGATVYSGILDNSGSLALTKTGSGTLTLAGANTYTGATAIHGGTLALGIAGSIASTSLVVGDTGSTGAVLDVTAKSGGYPIASGKTLSGKGTVNGAITIRNSGILAPGNNDTATLTFSDNLTFDSGSNYAVQVTSGTTCDKVSLPGKTLAANGTITFTAVGHTYAIGDSYDVADATTITRIPTISPATPGSGLVWDTSMFIQYGIINVISSDPYERWAGPFDYNLTGADAAKRADPDGDGANNLLEFATNSDPTTGSTGPRVYPAMVTIGIENVLTYTIAVRKGTLANFVSPASPDEEKKTATRDKVKYTVEATNDFADWSTVPVTEVTDVNEIAHVHAALGDRITTPAISSDWEWKTFRTDAGAVTDPGDFIRLQVEEAP